MRSNPTKLLPSNETQIERHTWTGRFIRRAAVVFIATFWLVVGVITVFTIA